MYDGQKQLVTQPFVNEIHFWKLELDLLKNCLKNISLDTEIVLEISISNDFHKQYELSK